ncbi:MAG: MG2 domain-containing protein [Tannerellaceae bacterium]|nr:MG2 domain-containing protein [Tannerellaceae bacterium]
MRNRMKECIIGIITVFLLIPMTGKSMEQMTNQADIRKWITLTKQAMDVDADQLPERIKELEKESESIDETGTRAIVHSMLAELYQSYYRVNAWQINQRTPLAGYVPADIREWPANLFTDKVKEHLDASLRPAVELQQIPVSRFDTILETGADSPLLRPTLFDFLVWRALEIQPAEEYYQALLNFRRTREEQPAGILAELAWLRFTYSFDQAYEEALDQLLEQYKGKDFSVEIVDAKLNLLDVQRFQVQNQDSIQEIAYRLAQETVRKFPHYPRIGLVKNRILGWENPSVRMEMPGMIYPDHPFLLTLGYRNVTQAEIVVYESRQTPEEIWKERNSGNRETGKRGKEVYRETIPLTFTASYREEKKELSLSGVPVGVYELVVEVPGEEINISQWVYSTTVSAVYRTLNGRGVEVYVTDLVSGKPLEGIPVQYYEGNRNQMQPAGTVITDAYGMAQLPAKKEVAGFEVPDQGADGTFITPVYLPWYSDSNRESQPQVTFFTDRNLYRPGQTLFFKGILYVNDKQDPRVVAGQPVKVSLYDANNQEVAVRELKSNEFGSFQGEFIIPLKGLTGLYSIRTANGNHYVRVEEYKRPSFRVEIDPVKEDIAGGDEVTIRGQAMTYSGIPLTEGKGTYRIVKQDMLWRRYPSAGDNQVGTGVIQLRPDGTFEIPFRTLTAFYRYQVQVMVTDTKGETQEAFYQFSAGGNSMLLYLENYQQRAEKEKLELTVKAQTINGEPVPAKGQFYIYQLQQEGDIWKEGKLLTSGTFETGVPLKKELFAALPSGAIRIRFESPDSKGREAEAQYDITLYGRKDTAPPVFSPIWSILPAGGFIPGDEVEIVVGTSLEDAFILYEVLDGKEQVKREVLLLNKENRTLRLRFMENWKDGVLLSFTLVKEGKLYKETAGLYRRYPDRTLTFHPVTFRDRLKPGQTEEWRFRIDDPNAQGIYAEVLAAMYDKSLDQIYSSVYNFSLQQYPSINIVQFTEGEGMRIQGQMKEKKFDPLSVPDYQYDRLDWQGLQLVPAIRVRGYRAGVRSLAGSVVREAAVEDSDMAVLSSVAVPSAKTGVQNEAQSDGLIPGGGAFREEKISVADIRVNFNETAFFYPNILTDKEGNFQVQFTIPESNTTWHLQMVAHTPDLKYGLWSQDVITQKPIMVIPNLPRFVRKGDRIQIASQIVNQTSSVIRGTVMLELFDPVTNQLLPDQPEQSKKELTLEQASTGSVVWEWLVPDREEMVGIRIVATSPEGSDGEQHLLPVVTDQILITESIPFYMKEEGTEILTLASGWNKKNRTPYSLTFEMSTNPVWYAVQALPTLTDPKSDNVIDWFNAWFSNTLARSLVTTTPRLSEMITLWVHQGGNAESLFSQLQKNEELKQIILAETPWVLDAKQEEEQIQRLALLFDLNRATWQREQALKMLSEQQLDSGGWGWFQGLAPSRRMTLYILKGMSQLTALNAVEYGQQEREMQMKALRYLDGGIRDDYQALQNGRTDQKKYIPSGFQLEYLFVRSAFRDIPEQGDAREAFRYFTGQMEKQWKEFSLEGKAWTAMLLYRNGNKKAAGEIVNWFRKTATRSEEKGMYWANNRRTAGQFHSPVEVHTAIMEMFREIDPVQSETDQMKQWLLTQKRTQHWSSSPATLQAVYILFKTGSGWLEQTNSAIVEWGNKSLSADNGKGMAGYIKVSVSQEEITPDYARVIIRKEGNTPAWGALYTQYFTPLDDVEQSGGLLQIEKKLFIETNSGTQRQLTPVTESRPLQVGDKVVVRLVVRASQEMNYVHLHDVRAGYLEPSDNLSGLQYRDRLVYYHAPADLSEDFFIERLPEGTFVLEYSGYVTRAGEYNGGISTIQCLYAPEYIAHTAGERMEVRK